MPISVPRMVASTMPIDGHLQRVQDADDQRPAIGVDGRVVGDQRLADRDAGDAAEEGEAGGDVARGEVAVGVADQIPDDRSTTMPTMTTCQTMARNTGSDQDRRSAFLARHALRSGADRQLLRTWPRKPPCRRTAPCCVVRAPVRMRLCGNQASKINLSGDDTKSRPPGIEPGGPRFGARACVSGSAARIAGRPWSRCC